MTAVMFAAASHSIRRLNANTANCATVQLQVVMGAIVYGSVMNLEAQFYRYEVGAEVSTAVHYTGYCKRN
jgi:hypothetical protein